MNDRTKKILVLVVFILAVFGIAIALYWAFFRPAPPPPTVGEPTTELPPGVLPGSQEGVPGTGVPGSPTGPGTLPTAEPVATGGVTEVTTLTTSEVVAPTRSADGSGVSFYNPEDGRFYTIDADGNIVALSDRSFPSAESIAWNGTANKAVIEFPDGSNVVYDFDSERQVTLPNHWEDFEFSPIQDEILAKSIAVDPNNRWLVVSNSDGSNVKAVAAVGLNDDKVEISWSPNDQVIAFADTAEQVSGGLDRKMILPIGKNSENYKGLVVEGLGFASTWSPSGKQLLYSVAGEYSDNKPLLWIVDATPGTMGENRRSLGLNTWVDKCTFADATTVYCAVPVSLPANSGLQRGLWANTPDHLYKIELTTGRSSRIAIPETTSIMEELSVSSDGSILYFTSATSGRLGSIRLK